MFIDVYFEILSDKGPDSYIKLPLFIKKRSFDVFLNDPVILTYRLAVQELIDVSKVPQNLDTSALICTLRFNDPNIFFTVFLRDPFSSTTASGELFKTVIESCQGAIILLSLNEKCSGSRIKHGVVCGPRFFILLIIFLK